MIGGSRRVIGQRSDRGDGQFVAIGALAELLAIETPAEAYPLATVDEPLERADRTIILIRTFDRRHGPFVAKVIGRLAFEVVLLGRRVVGVDFDFPSVVLPEGSGVFTVCVMDIVEHFGHDIELVCVLVPTHDVADIDIADINFAAANGLNLRYWRIETVVADRIRIDRHDVPIRQVAVHGRDEIVGELHGEIKFAGRSVAKSHARHRRDQGCS